MSNKTVLIIGIVLIAGFVGLQALSNNPQVSEEKISVIRIGSTAPGHLKFILFQEKGWMDEEFAKDGIKVEYYPFTGGGAEALMALSSGSLDISYNGADPGLRTAAAGADIKLIGISSFGNPASGASSIIVRNDSKITSVKDLKGKKVAYLKGTMRHATIIKALEIEGMSINDIESFNLNFQASGPALLKGDIDALVEGETTIFELVSKGAARTLWSGKDHPEISSPASGINVRGDFARKHPDIVKRLLKIDLKTARWADENPDETIKIFSKATKKDEKNVREVSYPENKFYQDPQITDKALQSLKDEEQFMKANGLIEGKVDFNLWVDRSFIDSVLKEK
ncbi:MAG: aliphatic sulfonate ABC transporter substrate-binding protein [Candidatus Methanoperedens sp.]|nr:aliphatic sulfonate ABC transporter substrate-binding protein [Candidatus Methanoperedens sp.]